MDVVGIRFLDITGVKHMLFMHTVNLDRPLETHDDLQFIPMVVRHLTADAVQSHSNGAIMFKNNRLFFCKHGISPQK
jgi:hypothetical protein